MSVQAAQPKWLHMLSSMFNYMNECVLISLILPMNDTQPMNLSIRKLIMSIMSMLALLVIAAWP